MPSAIAPEDTSTTSRPSPSQLRDLLGPARDRGVIEPAALVGDEARADLHDDALRAGDGVAALALRARHAAHDSLRALGRADVRRRRAHRRRRHGRTGCAASAAASRVATGHRRRRAPDARRASAWIAKVSSRQPSPSIAAIANTGPFQRYDFTNARDALLPLVLRDEVELVQHEPARLLVQRLVVALQLLHDRARVVHRDRRSRRAARGPRCAAAGACARDGAGSDGRGPRLRPHLR